MKQKYITNNSNQTKKIGEELAKEILKKKKNIKSAFIIGLIGKLGGGKTTFLQGFAKGLGIKEKILSPTFIIMRRFKLKTQSSKLKITTQNSKVKEFREFYHIDCYRIKNPKELLDLGFKEIIKNPKNIVAVEWADKIRSILPKNFLKIKFNAGADENIRKITFN